MQQLVHRSAQHARIWEGCHITPSKHPFQARSYAALSAAPVCHGSFWDAGTASHLRVAMSAPSSSVRKPGFSSGASNGSARAQGCKEHVLVSLAYRPDELGSVGILCQSTAVNESVLRTLANQVCQEAPEQAAPTKSNRQSGWRSGVMVAALLWPVPAGLPAAHLVS